MKDIGSLSYFLGIEVNRSPDGYFISQSKYASKIILPAGLTDKKKVETPLELNVKLNAADAKVLSNPNLYHWLVGSLNYLIVTRPDISYAVHIVSQFMSAPRASHFAATEIGKEMLQIDLLPPDIVLLGNSLISWRSKKQSVVSHSSVEA
ncbi:uncharacterized protein LOC113305419 [Papaver somniferum]|uniref:uncharacterized protein LOC113305419 n=1 Tax=Papaver somniferum TaxID=3469 RepID=UPI000E6FB435|nr:uncharacterized protein LOC113305419 [Papaver somniferum]